MGLAFKNSKLDICHVYNVHKLDISKPTAVNATVAPYESSFMLV